MGSYFPWFVLNFSDITSLLIDLIIKGVADLLQWMESFKQAFCWAKAVMCWGPLLHLPDFSLPFLLQTDAVDRVLEAVLSQVVEGVERPLTVHELSQSLRGISNFLLSGS